MTYPTLFYAAGIGLTYIASRHAFQHRIPYLHHIHDAIFSLSISYSAFLDIDSWLASGVGIAQIGGETHISVRPWSPVLPLVYTSYVIYKLIWERPYIPMYEKMKYNVGLTVVAMYHLTNLLPWTLAVIIYIAHGHVHVLEALLKAAQETALIQPYTYLRLRAIVYMWVIQPICWTHVLVAISYSVDFGTECWCLLGLLGYISFETYVAVIEYGYNRALLRVQEHQVGVEGIL
jgi:hypothetical protein